MSGVCFEMKSSQNNMKGTCIERLHHLRQRHLPSLQSNSVLDYLFRTRSSVGSTSVQMQQGESFPRPFLVLESPDQMLFLVSHNGEMSSFRCLQSHSSDYCCLHILLTKSAGPDGLIASQMAASFRQDFYDQLQSFYL